MALVATVFDYTRHALGGVLDSRNHLAYTGTSKGRSALLERLSSRCHLRILNYKSLLPFKGAT